MNIYKIEIDYWVNKLVVEVEAWTESEARKKAHDAGEVRAQDRLNSKIVSCEKVVEDEGEETP